MKIIDKNIIKVIEKLSHEVYLVKQDFSVKCTCVDFTTKQPDQFHDKCLGTGYQIKIMKIKTAGQTSSSSFSVSGSAESAAINTFYIKEMYPVHSENIIIDGDSIDVIQSVSKLKTDSNVPVYFKCTTVPKKSNVFNFFSDFNKLIGRA